MNASIFGRTRIFKNEFNGRASYCTTLSHKKQDGTYDKMYVSVSFAQCEATDGDIDITKGFLDFYTDKNGLNKIKYVVQEYMKVDNTGFSEVAQDDYVSDLPF